MTAICPADGTPLAKWAPPYDGAAVGWSCPDCQAHYPTLIVAGTPSPGPSAGTTPIPPEAVPTSKATLRPPRAATVYRRRRLEPGEILSGAMSLGMATAAVVVFSRCG
jgi:hypothetical protein